MGLDLDYNYLSPEFYTAVSYCWLAICFQHSFSWFLTMHWCIFRALLRLDNWVVKKVPFSKLGLLFLPSFCSTQGHLHRELSLALPQHIPLHFFSSYTSELSSAPSPGSLFPLLPSGEAAYLQLFTNLKELMSQRAPFRMTCLACGSRWTSSLVLQCERMQESYLLSQTLYCQA